MSTPGLGLPYLITITEIIPVNTYIYCNVCVLQASGYHISVLFNSCEGIPKISCDERQRSSVKKYQRSALQKN